MKVIRRTLSLLASVPLLLAAGCASSDDPVVAPAAPARESDVEMANRSATWKTLPPDTARSEREDFVETIPGTVVAIEMVALPDGLAGGWIGRTEITWDAYDVFVHRLDLPGEQRSGVGDAFVRPSQPYVLADYGFGHNGFPVISISHQGAEAFCVWLSERTGRRYRLPTEAEWTAVCAVGNDLPDASTLLDRAWVDENSEARTHEVGSRAPDALGLHDLLGNATEWCTTADDEPVAMGGCYLDAATEVICGARKLPTRDWNMRDPQIPKSPWWLSDASWAGFRIVCEDDG